MALAPSKIVLDAFLDGAVLVRGDLDPGLGEDVDAVHTDPAGEDGVDVPKGHDGLRHGDASARRRISELVDYHAVVQSVRVHQ